MNYNQEEKKLFQFYEDTYLLPRGDIYKYAINKNSYEFILTPKCDQKCDYCYLQNHQKDLYPYLATNEEILKNVDLFLDYVINQRKSYSYTIEFFGGDIFYNNLFFDSMNILEKYLEIVKNTEPELLSSRVTRIIIPNNLSWVPTHPEKVEKLFQMKDHFRKEYNVRIMFSWSCDGPYAAHVREKKDLNQDYYKTILDFCKAYESGHHPMIAASNIEYVKDNYDWWLEQYKTYSSGMPFDFQPMMLEVRNDDWTQDKIEKYLDFLTYAFEVRLKMCNNDKDNLARHLLLGDGKEGTLPRLENYDFLSLIFKEPGTIDEAISCDFQKAVYFNCNDLSLVPCHRTSYSNLVPLKFITNEDKSAIIDIEMNNFSSFFGLRTCKANLLPKCDQCYYNPLCIKGCLGAQIEANGDIGMPCESVCEMFIAKNNHIMKLMIDSGVFDIALEKNYFHSPYQRDFLISFKERLEKLKEMEDTDNE